MKKTIATALVVTIVVLCNATVPSISNAASVMRETYSSILGYKPDESIVFSHREEGEPLKLDCLFPSNREEDGNSGCIFIFFGGGWSGGDTQPCYACGKYFASRGLVTIAA